MTTGEFHLFSKLPAELRVEIWKLNQVPRVVTIEMLYRPWRDGMYLYKATEDVPANLHVNKESRYEALRSYQVIFRDFRDFRLSNPFFIDFAKDTTFFSSLTELDSFFHLGDKVLQSSHCEKKKVELEIIQWGL